MSAAPRAAGRRLPWIAAGAVIGLVALAVRFLVAKEVFSPLGLIFLESDPFYHARRIALTLAHFPRVIEYDSYVNFPEGARIIWPVGFDLLMATIGGVFGGFHDPEHALRICAIAIPLLALPGILFTGLLAHRVAGPLAGICAGALMAILPQQVACGLVGRIDHHVLEPFFLAATLLAFTDAACACDSRARDVRAVLAGALMAVAFWFVTTAILIPCYLAAGIVITRLLEAGRLADPRRLARPSAIAFGAAAVLLLPLVLSSSFGRAGEFSYLGLSWFQETAVVLVGLAVAGVHWILEPGHWLRRLGLAAAGAVLAGGAALVLTGLPEGRGVTETLSAVRDAAAFVFRKDPLVVNVQESESPLPAAPLQLVWSFSPWIFCAPLAWLALLAEGVRERFANPGRALIVAIFPIAFGFFLLQIRFGILLGVPLAVVAGWAVDRAWQSVAGGRRRVAAVVTLCIAVLTLPAAAWPLREEELATVRGVSDPAVRALRWMRDHTPPTRAYDDPRVRPEYGVVCSWDQGHAVTWFARRPNVANPFGQAPWHIRGALRASRILLETNVSKAVEECDDLSVRYLFLQATRAEIFSIATVGKGKRNDYAREERDAEGSEMLRVRPPYFETLHARLALFDGAMIPGPRGVLPVIPEFRLVYESPEAGEFPVYVRGRAEPLVPRLVKIFERVKGARLEGACEPGKPVEAFAEVSTNAGRRFLFSTSAPCGADGHFALPVPYAAPVMPGETGAVGPYLVRSVGREATALVTDTDVLKGRSLALRW